MSNARKNVFKLNAFGVSADSYGLKGDGVTNDAPAAQAMATAISAAGGNARIVFTPGKTYKFNSAVTFTAGNITVDLTGATIDASAMTYGAGRGDGSVFRFVGATDIALTTTLAASAVAGARTLQLTSVAGVAIGDLIRCQSDKVLYSDNGTLFAYYGDMNQVVGIAGSVVTLRSSLELPLSTAGQTVTVQVTKKISNCRVKGGAMIGGGVTETPLANSLGQCGVMFSNVVDAYVEGVDISRFQGIAAFTDRCFNFTVSGGAWVGRDEDVVVVEGVNSGFYGAYAIRTRNATFVGIRGNRLRHQCDGTEVYGFTQMANIAENTHQGAFGSHQACFDVLIKNNICRNCDNGVTGRFYSGAIEGNILDSTNVVIVTALMNSAEPGVGRLRIANNELRTATTALGAISVNGVYDLDISNNTIRAVDGVGIGFYEDKLGTVKITDNDITAGNSILLSVTATYTGAVTIQDNDLRDYTSSMIILRGGTLPSAPAKNIRILHNSGWPRSQASLQGIQLRAEGYYDGDTIELIGNTQFGDDSATLLIVTGALYRMRSWPIMEQNTDSLVTNRHNRRIGEGATGTIGTDATLLRGMRIDRIGMSPGQPAGWMVTTSGTEGTIAGVTGSITTGTTTLTLVGNTSAKVFSGSFVNVAGAGAAAGNLAARVVSISDDFTTATLDTAAGTTVAGAAVSRRAPVVAPLTDVQAAPTTGGNVTQATSKATTVTHSNLNGQITLNAASLAASTNVSFTLTNTQILNVTDLVMVTHKSGGTLGAYDVSASVSAAGSATIHVFNRTIGALAEAIVLQFAIMRGPT
jgi:hypothetical protein